MFVTLDFETYFDDDYTVKKIATSEYVRDPRFEVLSCAIKIDGKAPFCYFGKDDIQQALDKIDWPRTTLLCHHTHFDGLILSHHFKIVPARYACTLSMARGLHPKMQRNDLGTVAIKYGKQNKLPQPDFKGKHLDDILAGKQLKREIIDYNNGDVESCRQIYDEMALNFPVHELDLIDITVRMFADPILCIDMPLAQTELEAERARRAVAIEAAGVDIKILASNNKFPKALEALGIDVPTKPSPTVKDADGNPTRIPAIAKSDDSLQALLLHPEPKVVALVEGRLAAKSTLGESRAARMLLRGANGMRLPVYLNYFGAHTGRWSAGDKFNIQNFKHAHKVGGKLKEAIMAPPGYVIVKPDASQIEARIVAWIFDEEWILEAFRAGRDLYCEFGTEAYEREITKADIEERFVSKTCVLGLGFGMSGPKLQVSILVKSIEQGMEPVRLPLEVCFHLVTKYRDKCQCIVKGWKFMNDQGIGAMLSGDEVVHKCLTFKKGRVELPNGMALLYPGLSANVVKRGSAFFKGQVSEVVHDATYLGVSSRNKIYGPMFAENVVQALARIVVADVMRQVAERYRVVAMEHDAIAFLAPAAEADEALAWVTDLMAVSPEWAPNLPLASEGWYNVRYAK